MKWKANNVQEPDKHDDTKHGDGYMSMLKDGEKRHKADMHTELQFESGTDRRENSINPSATV